MRVARPLSKGWPPPGQDEEGDDKECTLKDRKLNFATSAGATRLVGWPTSHGTRFELCEVPSLTTNQQSTSGS